MNLALVAAIVAASLLEYWLGLRSFSVAGYVIAFAVLVVIFRKVANG